MRPQFEKHIHLHFFNEDVCYLYSNNLPLFSKHFFLFV